VHFNLIFDKYHDFGKFNHPNLNDSFSSLSLSLHKNCARNIRKFSVIECFEKLKTKSPAFSINATNEHLSYLNLNQVLQVFHEP
jgi:hypothetical protein